MKWFACVAFALAAGCQHGDAGKPADKQAAKPSDRPMAAVTDAYREDIRTLCDVVHLSEADKMPENERWPAIAMWLGPHIKTSEGHDFLVAIQPLTGEPKARALDAEARRVGLASCALSAAWR